MALPTRGEAQKALEEHTRDEYLLYHAKMVAVAMEGYGKLYGENADLWYTTGLLHDLDFEEHPGEHPAVSLSWFKEWGYPQELIDAVEVHACGYNGFTKQPNTKLEAGILACDEICGIFYAYRKLNPIPYGEMKVSSIKKRLAEKTFAAKIDRSTIYTGCEALGISIDDHIANLIQFFKNLPL